MTTKMTAGVDVTGRPSLVSVTATCVYTGPVTPVSFVPSATIPGRPLYTDTRLCLKGLITTAIKLAIKLTIKLKT